MGLWVVVWFGVCFGFFNWSEVWGFLPFVLPFLVQKMKLAKDELNQRYMNMLFPTASLLHLLEKVIQCMRNGFKEKLQKSDDLNH